MVDVTALRKLTDRHKRRWWWTRTVLLRVWSVQNWRKGYKFGWVQRHRCCDHTTPSHYRWCARFRAAGEGESDG